MLGILLPNKSLGSTWNKIIPANSPRVFPGVSKFFIKSPGLPVRVPNLPDKMDFWAFLCFSSKFSRFFHKMRTFLFIVQFLRHFCTQRLVHYNDESAFWSHVRVVKKFSSSRLIMNSRRLWNSHQRLKFLRGEASRGILKFRVSEMAFPGVFKRYFSPRMLCSFVRTHARLGTMPSKCRRH